MATSAEMSGSFGPYEIESRLGQGGMSTIYTARDPSGHLIALKILSDELAHDNEFVSRFRRESEVLLSLSHPNIIKGHDAGTFDGKLYLATELIDGRSIGEILELGGRFPQEVAVHVAADITAALKYAWDMQIVHRDIKPDNIMISGDGRVRLADFGLARSVAPEATVLSKSGAIIGTADYISPEQVSGESPPDVRSDMYSLGASLYHMLCGHKPCPGVTAGEVLRNLMHGAVTPLARRAPHVSAPVREIVEKMMAHAPADRYQTPSELMEALAAAPCDPASILTLSFFGTAKIDELRQLLEKTEGDTTNVLGASGAAPTIPLEAPPEPKSPPSSDAVRSDPLLASIPESMARKRLGGVTLLEKLGQGGMGAVYRGHHELLDIDVAVKVMLFHLAHDGAELDRMRSRFRREARLAVRMDHPGVVRTLEIATDDASGLSYMVMELIEGRTAADLLDQALGERQAYSERTSLSIVQQAARALAQAHRQGIVHRDVKPGNLLIRDADGVVKIADLGLAKSILGDDSQGLTRSDAAVGSPAYMAPEQALDAKSVGTSADIYSLGATLYHLVTGRRPFDADNMYQLVHKIVSEPPPPPRTVNRHLSVNTENIIMRAMAKEVPDRYKTADDMADDIGKALEVLGTDSVVVRAARRRQRLRKWLLVGGIAAAALVGGVVSAIVLLG